MDCLSRLKFNSHKESVFSRIPQVEFPQECCDFGLAPLASIRLKAEFVDWEKPINEARRLIANRSGAKGNLYGSFICFIAQENLFYKKSFLAFIPDDHIDGGNMTEFMESAFPVTYLSGHLSNQQFDPIILGSLAESDAQIDNADHYAYQSGGSADHSDHQGPLFNSPALKNHPNAFYQLIQFLAEEKDGYVDSSVEIVTAPRGCVLWPAGHLRCH